MGFSVDEVPTYSMDDLISLAERICETFQQETVIVEIQRNGRVVTTLTVTP